MTEKTAGEKAPGSRLARLADAVGARRTRDPAPVERWNPPYCGEIAMRIAVDGTWFYEGTPINRPALVSLFAGILRKDPERYVLVTPVECVGIEVEDVPFVAVAMQLEEPQAEGPQAEGEILRFVTNLGDEVEVGAAHGMRFSLAADGGVVPYVHIRGGLWARLTRSLSIDLLDRVVTERDADGERIGIRSGGQFFVIDAADAPA